MRWNPRGIPISSPPPVCSPSITRKPTLRWAAGALRDRLLHQYGRGEWRAESVSDHRTRERGCDLESDATRLTKAMPSSWISCRRSRPLPQASSLTDVITNERKIETMVLANDGNIVVLGGLVKDKVIGRRVKVCRYCPVFPSWVACSAMTR